jgi:uncharacterized lipoprotein YmbA
MSLFLIACSSEQIKPSYYLLRSDLANDTYRAIEPSGIVLSHIGVATYIDQSGLVLETAEGQINIAARHLWAEPLRHSLKGFFVNEISQAFGKDIYAKNESSLNYSVGISIHISQLHGTLDGNAVLQATWSITTSTDKESQQTHFLFSKQQALADDGYDALVIAEKSLLKELAIKIAQQL